MTVYSVTVMRNGIIIQCNVLVYIYNIGLVSKKTVIRDDSK